MEILLVMALVVVVADRHHRSFNEKEKAKGREGGFRCAFVFCFFFCSVSVFSGVSARFAFNVNWIVKRFQMSVSLSLLIYFCVCLDSGLAINRLEIIRAIPFEVYELVLAVLLE